MTIERNVFIVVVVIADVQRRYGYHVHTCLCLFHDEHVSDTPKIMTSHMRSLFHCLMNRINPTISNLKLIKQQKKYSDEHVYRRRNTWWWRSESYIWLKQKGRSSAFVFDKIWFCLTRVYIYQQSWTIKKRMMVMYRVLCRTIATDSQMFIIFMLTSCSFVKTTYLHISITLVSDTPEIMTEHKFSLPQFHNQTINQ